MTQRSHERRCEGDRSGAVAAPEDAIAVGPGAAPASDGGGTAEPEPIRQYGDPVLRVKARPIRKINAGIRELVKRMTDAMYAADGVGLAAPQIGEPRRVVVYDTGEGLTVLINPRIVAAEGTVSDVEACLSVLGLCGEVERYQRVRVKALDLDGKEITIDGEDHLARVLQHELDHLDGVLYTDRAYAIRASAPSQDDLDDAEDDADVYVDDGREDEDTGNDEGRGDEQRAAGTPGDRQTDDRW